MEKIEFYRHDIGDAELSSVAGTLKSLFLTLGPRVGEFELSFGAFLGQTHVVGVSSCTMGLVLSLEAIGIQPGDEVITTPMTFISTPNAALFHGAVPVFADVDPKTGIVDPSAVEAAITPRTKVLHFCHITNLTGQLFPVKRLSQMARQRGILTIVDGAHAFAHFPYKMTELDCDYYGTSLHKWLLAPHNTGFLYVRRERIEPTWPLTAAPARRSTDIRKFEEVGTIAAAPFAAINEALAFHQAIGVERRAARMHYLTLRWANRIKQNPRVQMHTDLNQAYGLATVGIQGIKAADINKFLWDKYRIITATIAREDYQGVRVTPNIYSTLEEVDTFAAAMEDLLKNGVPGTA